MFEPLFNRLEDLNIIFTALELGNEINSPSFNGEFPIPGEGRVFGLGDLLATRKHARLPQASAPICKL